jgi:hypothetical protein
MHPSGIPDRTKMGQRSSIILPLKFNNGVKWGTRPTHEEYPLIMSFGPIVYKFNSCKPFGICARTSHHDVLNAPDWFSSVYSAA